MCSGPSDPSVLKRWKSPTFALFTERHRHWFHSITNVHTRNGFVKLWTILRQLNVSIKEKLPVNEHCLEQGTDFLPRGEQRTENVSLCVTFERDIWLSAAEGCLSLTRVAFVLDNHGAEVAEVKWSRDSFCLKPALLFFRGSAPLPRASLAADELLQPPCSPEPWLRWALYLQ